MTRVLVLYMRIVQTPTLPGIMGSGFKRDVEPQVAVIFIMCSAKVLPRC